MNQEKTKERHKTVVWDTVGLPRRPLDGALDTIAEQRAQMDKAIKDLIKVKMLTPMVARPIDAVIADLQVRSKND